jgi:hypothetical protein
MCWVGWLQQVLMLLPLQLCTRQEMEYCTAAEAHSAAAGALASFRPPVLAGYGFFITAT